MNRPDSGHRYLTVADDGIVLSVHVQPRASKNQICGLQGEAIKIRLTSPPVDGAANKLCRDYLANIFLVARSYVKIISGDTSRHKRVKIIGDPAQLERIIESIIFSS